MTILFLKPTSSNHLICQQNNFFLEIVLFRMTYLASTWTMGHSMAPSLKCLRLHPSRSNEMIAKMRLISMLVTTIPEGFPQIRPSLISFPYLCPTGDISNIHIFLHRSDKHTSHLVKKKNVRNIDIRFDTYNLLESPFFVFPYHSMTHWFLQTTSKIISSRINNKLWCLISLNHHRYYVLKHFLL